MPTPDVKLAARRYRIDLHRCFARASPTVENYIVENYIVLEIAEGYSRTYSHVAKLLQCSSLAVRKFCAASEERCERG